MSWSVQHSGNREELKNHLHETSERLTGQSKQEFEEAKPHLVGLIDQNLGERSLTLNASGHATFNDQGAKTHGECRVNLS